MCDKNAGEWSNDTGGRGLKNTVLMFTGGISFVLALLIIMSLYERMNYRMEIECNLSSVMEAQITELMIKEKYTTENEKEFLVDFVQHLIVAIDGKYSLGVDILQLDMEKGIMTVRVTADFVYLNGKAGTAVCERTVLFENL